MLEPKTKRADFTVDEENQPILPHCCNRAKLCSYSPTSISFCNIWLGFFLQACTPGESMMPNSMQDPVKVPPNPFDTKVIQISTRLEQLLVLAEAKGNQSGELKIRGLIMLYQSLKASNILTQMHTRTNTAQEILAFKLLIQSQISPLQTHPTIHVFIPQSLILCSCTSS